MNYKEQRKKLKLTQVQVAREVGVNINTYINWENQVSHPNLENKEKLENILKGEQI